MPPGRNTFRRGQFGSGICHGGGGVEVSMLARRDSKEPARDRCSISHGMFVDKGVIADLEGRGRIGEGG